MDKHLEKALRKVPMANKYRAKRSGSALFGGRMFDSKAERDRAEGLKAMEQDGSITDLELQPQTVLTRAGINYKPDFAYTEGNGVRYWEDVKGVETEGFRIKAKLWSCYGPGPLRITKRKSVKAGFQVTKTIYIKNNEQLDQGKK